MKTKKKCDICPQRFEAVRSDAKYCSGACKQKAHSMRQRSEIHPFVTKETFQFSEYQAILDECGYESEIFTLIFFCFLRRNFPTNASLEMVITYINSVWTCENYNELTSSKAYHVFQEEFLSNNISIQ